MKKVVLQQIVDLNATVTAAREREAVANTRAATVEAVARGRSTVCCSRLAVMAAAGSSRQVKLCKS